MTAVTTIEVNGTPITTDELNREMEFHTCDNLAEAQHEAARALVVRELLCQRAVELGLCSLEACLNDPDPIIDQLLEQELETRVPEPEEVRRYYDNNRQRFFSSPVFEVSHILYPAPPDDADIREHARAQAAEDLNQIREGGATFAQRARAQSACPSAENDGYLGEVTRGQTVPGFETALLAMDAGELCTEPVASEVGFHLIQVHQRSEAEPLAFEEVQDFIARLLSEQRWRHAFSQYVQLLAGEARITGFDLQAAETPLVQ